MSRFSEKPVQGLRIPLIIKAARVTLARVEHGGFCLKKEMGVLMLVIAISLGGCISSGKEETQKDRQSQTRAGTDCEPKMNGDGSVWKVVCR